MQGNIYKNQLNKSINLLKENSFRVNNVSLPEKIVISGEGSPQEPMKYESPNLYEYIKIVSIQTLDLQYNIYMHA